MGQSAGVWLVLVASLLAANLPFLNERLIVVGRRRESKRLAWLLPEFVVLGAATLALGFAIESGIGQRQAQDWEFCAALAWMLLTLAVPGFVWRHLRRRR